MKCSGRIVALLVLLHAGAVLQAQQLYTFSSAHYTVFTDSSEARAMEVGRKLEAALLLYNEYLHYDVRLLDEPLRVRIFAQKSDYDAYLDGLISETRSDFVFISYRDSARSELVGFDREEEQFNPSLLHYGFIQFLSSFIPSAPLWIEEGMATYLEYCAYDPMSERFTWRANYAWLDSLKGILEDERIKAELTLRDLLLIDKEQAQVKIELFYPSAWGLVQFLLQSTDKSHNRILWESLSSLDGSSTLEENSRRVLERAFRWVDLGQLQVSFESYIGSLMTFNDLVRLGVDQYGSRELDSARESFEMALELRADNYIPYYYLGLIAYREKDFQQADSLYNRSLDLGIDEALINYALGVNAFADQRYPQAREYLERAKALDPESYSEKGDALLKRIDIMQ